MAYSCAEEAAGCFSNNGARLQPWFLTRACKTATVLSSNRCTCAVSDQRRALRAATAMHCKMLVSYRPLGQVPEGWRREPSRAVVLADDAVLLANGDDLLLAPARSAADGEGRLPGATPAKWQGRHAALREPPTRPRQPLQPQGRQAKWLPMSRLRRRSPGLPSRARRVERSRPAERSHQTRQQSRRAGPPWCSAARGRPRPSRPGPRSCAAARGRPSPGRPPLT